MTAPLRIPPCADMAQHEDDWTDRSPRFPSGWWLLPCLILGPILWVVLGYWLSGVIAKALIEAALAAGAGQ